MSNPSKCVCCGRNVDDGEPLCIPCEQVRQEPELPDMMDFDPGEYEPCDDQFEYGYDEDMYPEFDE